MVKSGLDSVSGAPLDEEWRKRHRTEFLSGGSAVEASRARDESMSGFSLARPWAFWHGEPSIVVQAREGLNERGTRSVAPRGRGTDGPRTPANGLSILQEI